MHSEYRANWYHAMEREIGGLEGAGTFGITQKQKGANVISAKRVFTWKSNENGKVVN